MSDVVYYIIAAFRNLTVSFNHSIHITWVPYDIHHVCERIIDEHKEINKFVSLIKTNLLKSKERRNIYKTMTKLQFPSNPVITSWGTFL